VQTSRVQQSLVGHTGGAVDIAFSPDQTLIATAANDGTVTIWDRSSGEELTSFHLTGTPVQQYQDLYFSADGTRLTTLSRDEEIAIYLETWDLAAPTASEQRQLLFTVPYTYTFLGSYGLSPDLQQLAVGYTDGTAGVWDIATGQRTITITGYTNWVTAVFAPDNKHLLTLSDEGTGDLWLLSENGPQLVVADIQHEGGVAAPPIFNADSTLLLTNGSKAEEAILWDLSLAEGTAQPRFIWTGNTGFLTSQAFSPDGHQVAATGQDGVVIVSDIQGGEAVELYRLTGHSNAILDVEFSPDGLQLGTASLDGTARLWNATPLGAGEWLAASSPVGRTYDIALSPEEQLLAIAYVDSPSRVFDAATGELLLTLPGFTNTVVTQDFPGQHSVSFSPDGRRLATGGADGFAHVWDATTGERLLAIEAHDPAVHTGFVLYGTAAVQFSPDGSRLVTAGSDGWVRIWEAETGEELLSFLANERGVRNVIYSPDGRLLATGHEGETAAIWDASTGEELFSLPGHPTVLGLAFSPDGTLLTTGASLVKVWDVATGEERYTLPSQNSSVGSVQFSSDGRFLVTGGGDAIRLWDAMTGEERLTLAKRNGTVAFSQDGSRLYFSDRTGTTLVFALLLDDLTAIAQSRLTRWFTAEECQQYLHTGECPARESEQ
jgi:WD40 repeat protein